MQHFCWARRPWSASSVPSAGLTIFYKHLGSTHQKVVDAVVLAVGWPSNADTLNLAAAGVETDRGYVVVDPYLRTTASHIFAAGDVNGQMMLVQSASYEGRIAAENAVLGVGQRYVHSVVPHGGFTDPEYASVGLTEEEARRRREQDCLVAVVPYADLDRAVIDDRTTGYCKLIVSQDSHRILGAHRRRAGTGGDPVGGCGHGRRYVGRAPWRSSSWPTPPTPPLSAWLPADWSGNWA
jgi:pyruvate/2-oxoglutarate dehydrogenase complex dihydrolipoamide dehydrogenase (E3) component